MEVNTEVCDWLMSDQGVMWQRDNFNPIEHAATDWDMPGKSPATMFMSAKGFEDDWGNSMYYIADEKLALPSVVYCFNNPDNEYSMEDAVHDLTVTRGAVHP